MKQELPTLSQFDQLPPPIQECIRRLLEQDLFPDAKRLYDSFLKALEMEGN